MTYHFENNEGAVDLRNLTAQDFKNYGIQEIAYIKPVSIKDQKGFAIHAADGTTLTVLDDYDSALTLARHNDLEPVTVH